jgi:hypothetical protein
MLQCAFRFLLRFYELYNLVEVSLYCWLILKIIIIIFVPLYLSLSEHVDRLIGTGIQSKNKNRPGGIQK